jgi:hypothetical protein
MLQGFYIISTTFLRSVGVYILMQKCLEEGRNYATKTLKGMTEVMKLGVKKLRIKSGYLNFRKSG